MCRHDKSVFMIDELHGSEFSFFAQGGVQQPSRIKNYFTVFRLDFGGEKDIQDRFGVVLCK